MLQGHKIIALCITKVADDRSIEIIRELNDALTELDYRLIVYQTCSDLYWKKISEEGDKAVFDLIDYDIIDGVIVSVESIKDSSVVDKIVAQARLNNAPIVTYGGRIEGVTNVSFDYKSGFEQVVEHLIQVHNIRDYAFIAGISNNTESEERIEVFRKVLDRNGIEFDESMLFYGDYWWRPTIEAIDRMNANGRIPRAVVCANDTMAIAAADRLGQLGYRVPEDVAVTGFDGILEAKISMPTITTASCDMQAFARKIVKIIVDKMDNKYTDMEYPIPYKLDIYHSCGCKDCHPVINTGSLVKDYTERFGKYRADELSFYDLNEKVMTCESSLSLIRYFEKAHLFETAIVLNQDCFDCTVNPSTNVRTDKFDDVMKVLFQTGLDLTQYPLDIPRKELMPHLEWPLTAKRPIVITALSFSGKPIGYMCFYTEPEIDTYCKVQQFVTNINKAIGSYRLVRNLEYMVKSLDAMAKTDYSTGLLNRAGFYDALDSMVYEGINSERTDYVLVASVDMDGLKKINDTYGHDSGDAAIKYISEAIQTVPYRTKICGRFGGDEFIVCACINDPAEADQMEKAVNRYLDNINDKGLLPYTLSVSVGTYVTSTDDFIFDKSLRESDILMYKTKIEHKKNCVN